LTQPFLEANISSIRPHQRSFNCCRKLKTVATDGNNTDNGDWLTAIIADAVYIVTITIYKDQYKNIQLFIPPNILLYYIIYSLFYNVEIMADLIVRAYAQN